MRESLVLWRGRRRRRRRLAAGLAGVLLAGLLALRWLGPLRAAAGALGAKTDRALADALRPGYTARLDALQDELFALRRTLASQAGLAAENTALRSLLGSEPRPAGRWQPAAVAARALDGRLTLAAPQDLPVGAAVLDAEGRWFGAVAGPGPAGHTIVADPAGQGAGAVPALAGGQNGVLVWHGGRLWLAGLPRHNNLAAGTLVTTADGLWAGMLAEAPMPDETGLNERAPLTDTAAPGTFCFVPAG